MKISAIFLSILIACLLCLAVLAQDKKTPPAPPVKPEETETLDILDGLKREMIQTEIKGAGILTGERGQKAVDLEAIAEIIVKVSELAVKHPEIKEIDLNPVTATAQGVVVVDARVMV